MTELQRQVFTALYRMYVAIKSGDQVAFMWKEALRNYIEDNRKIAGLIPVAAENEDTLKAMLDGAVAVIDGWRLPNTFDKRNTRTRLATLWPQLVPFSGEKKPSTRMEMLCFILFLVSEAVILTQTEATLFQWVSQADGMQQKEAARKFPRTVSDLAQDLDLPVSTTRFRVAQLEATGKVDREGIRVHRQWDDPEQYEALMTLVKKYGRKRKVSD